MSLKDVKAPMCEKLNAVSGDSNKLGEFVDWLSSEGIHLATWLETLDDGRPRITPLLIPMQEGLESVLARYFEIDLKEVEKERRALLAALAQEPTR